MPTYQYACTNAECGNRFERVQAFTDPTVTQCPVCEQRVRKVYGSVGVVFKGSGFYRTDSRTETQKSDGKAAAESKPAATADSKATSPSTDGSGNARPSSSSADGAARESTSSSAKKPAAATAS
jgi:putative FmdB family regulatory protein